MEFKYETHLHTMQGSACSKITGAQAADFYKSLGYTGIFVTDHFFNGYTAVKPMDSWSERVGLFCKGYEDALSRGKEIGLDVFFGFEFQYSGTHFLVYNLGESWLCDHPEIMDMRPNEFLEFASAEGGLVVQAHPFREASYVKYMRLFPRNVDAVEYLNSSDKEDCAVIGKFYADHYGIRGFAGSDTHFTEREALSGLKFNEKILDTEHFLRLIKEGKYTLFIEKI